MELKLIVILLSLIGGTYSIVLNILRYRSASNPTPENLKDVYDAESYEKWKKYSAEHCRLDIVFAIITMITSIALLSTNAYSAFASLFPQEPLLSDISVIILECAIGAVFDTVKHYVSTMVIEQKYGFNRTSKKTFIIDTLKRIALEFLLSLLLVELIALGDMLLGVWMIPVVAGTLFALSLVISFLYPILSRLGNKFTPLEDGELKDRLMALLTDHGYKVKAIEVIDASRRTTKLNAYFTGFGKLKTIVLYDNLVNSMSTDEICSVFAHELGHGLNKDVTKMQVINSGNFLLIGAAAWGILELADLYAQFGFESVNYGFTYIVLGLAIGLIQPLMSMVVNAYSRRAEYRADAQAVKEGYGESMVVALKKLARENFAHLSPAKLNVLLEYSHPPMAERIAAIEKETEKKKTKEDNING